MLSRFIATPAASRFATPVAPAPASVAPAPAPVAEPVPAPSGAAAEYVQLKVRLHQELLDVINLAAIDKLDADQFRREIGEMVRELLAREKVALNAAERGQLVNDLLDELLGLGPIEPLLKDPTVSDILVNTHEQVFVERAGRLETTPVRFKDEKHLLRIINKIVSAVGRRVDESQPLVDARLPDGSRVNAVVPPVAVDGPLLSIRKFAKIPFTIERLLDAGALTREMAEFLRCVVRGRQNIVISGGTGSGKTTMLNALSNFIDHAERIVTIEDAAELQLQQPHVARMETRPPNMEGRGEIAQRDLVKNALRMRPDRVILGEVRAGEAFDMLQAMNTGHDGSMTTVHANTCRDAVGRLEQMIGMAGIEMPVRSIRGQIASAIDIVLQLERMGDGRRRLVSVHEIVGMEGDVIVMNEIFLFRRERTDADGTVHGRHWATGLRPRCLEDLKARGLTVEPAIFSPDRPLG
ncbi:CpaF family protein [Azospirillum sp.]|uniref:CpaF family protein n=1 Tax=Azospirillum sp. TaxID=34012 RepID=UPI002D7405B9|nr:CpaF family protein [Azospirillum sp.]HYD66411.1 CpaF family protein [Azospirillum sp.]